MRYVSQIFNFENFATSPGTSLKFLTLKTFAMSSGTFLKFSTLKNLPCYAERLSFFFLIQKFCHVLRQFPHFTNLSTCLLHFQLLLGGGVRVCVCGGGDVVLC